MLLMFLLHSHMQLLLQVHVLLDLGVFLDEGEAAGDIALVGRVLLLLVLLAVAQWMVHILVHDALEPLVLSQVALVVTHAQHRLALAIQSIIVIHVVRECPCFLRR